MLDAQGSLSVVDPDLGVRTMVENLDQPINMAFVFSDTAGSFVEGADGPSQTGAGIGMDAREVRPH